MLGAVTVDVHQIFISDAAQFAAQFKRDPHGVELGVVAHDRLDRVDMMFDQRGGHLVEVGRVLDDSAQAFRGGGSGGIAEGCGIALDVVGGAKQLVAGFLAGDDKTG